MIGYLSGLSDGPIHGDVSKLFIVIALWPIVVPQCLLHYKMTLKQRLWASSWVNLHLLVIAKRSHLEDEAQTLELMHSQCSTPAC